MKSVFRIFFFVLVLSGISTLTATADGFQEKQALAASQSAIGRSIGDLTFRDSRGGSVRLSDFLGKPLVLNFIYTGCAQSCNVTTVWLVETFETAREALGADSFTALTIGFDTVHDTPGRMRQFAGQRGADSDPGWHFLSGDEASVTELASSVGFTYFKSSKGFDHLDQATLINADGLVQAQVYGETFDKPLLIDPLKDLVFGTSTPFRSLDDLIKKVRLFCTLYDPASDRYQFDYSLFIMISSGFVVIGSVLVFLVRELWSRPRRRRRNIERSA